MLIMSNNQWRYDDNNEVWRAMGEDCSAEMRSAGFIRAYTEFRPDVLGLQETSPRMAELLMAALRGEYTYVSGGDTPLLYRSERFDLMESGYFCYPEAVPGLPGSYNNYRTKSYCFAVLREKAGGRRVAVASTHLWWMSGESGDPDYCPGSDEARAWQLRLVIARLDELSERYDCPAFIMGDFNAVMGSPCLEAAGRAGYSDVHELATGFRDETRGRHYCFPDGFRHDEPGCFAEAIDHIIVKPRGGLAVKAFRRYQPLWFDKLSDHFPLYTEIEL